MHDSTTTPISSQAFSAAPSLVYVGPALYQLLGNLFNTLDRSALLKWLICPLSSLAVQACMTTLSKHHVVNNIVERLQSFGTYTGIILLKNPYGIFLDIKISSYILNYLSKVQVWCLVGIWSQQAATVPSNAWNPPSLLNLTSSGTCRMHVVRCNHCFSSSQPVSYCQMRSHYSNLTNYHHQSTSYHKTMLTVCSPFILLILDPPHLIV